MSETAQDFNGIKIDLNRVTRREFHSIMGQVAKAQRTGNGLLADEMTGELVEKVVIEWPFGAEISQDAYQDLTMHDAQAVDAALEAAILTLSKKKSVNLSGSPPSSSSP